jgi:peptidoglycan LD-endopeptidase CwlK
MTYKLGARSIDNLSGVHPDLVKVVKRAIEITEQDFTVIEGLRTKERQKELVKRGASKTMNSRHLTGHAVDLAVWKDGAISWDTGTPSMYYELSDNDSYELYQEIGTSMLMAAKELRIPIRWGADWDGDYRHSDERFLDWVHFELQRKYYP